MKKTKPVVLITGASQGIGAAIAREFAAQVKGVRLALVARNAANLRRVAAACAKHGARAEVFPCDVTEAAEVEALAGAVQQRCGAVDVLINNAGKFTGAPLIEMSVAAFDDMIATNLRSVFLVSRAFVPAMAKRGRGDVFNLCSIAALVAYAGGGAYSAAKFGVAGLSKVMRAELKDQGVRVCCVYPGATDSPTWNGSGVSPARMMPASDLAHAMLEVYRLTRRTVVEEIVLRPQLGDL